VTVVAGKPNCPNPAIFRVLPSERGCIGPPISRSNARITGVSMGAHSCRLNRQIHRRLGRNAAFRLQQHSTTRWRRFPNRNQKSQIQNRASRLVPLIFHIFCSSDAGTANHAKIPNFSLVQAITGYYRLLQAITAFFLGWGCSPLAESCAKACASSSQF